MKSKKLQLLNRQLQISNSADYNFNFAPILAKMGNFQSQILYQTYKMKSSNRPKFRQAIAPTVCPATVQHKYLVQNDGVFL